MRTIITYLALSAVLFAGAFVVHPQPVLALSLSDYFTYRYTFTFSKPTVAPGEAFYITVSGQATCIQDLPVSVSALDIVSSVVARYQQGGTDIILNANYSISYSGFPTKKGQTTSASVQVPLSFPGDSPSGAYSVEGRIQKAIVRTFIDVDLVSLGLIPTRQEMGTVTCSLGGGGGGGGAPIYGPEKSQAATQTPAQLPASFTVSNLEISMLGATAGGMVIATVLISNTGDLSGDYEAVMKVDGTPVVSQNVTLAGKSTQRVDFIFSAAQSGDHTVAVDSLLKHYSVAVPVVAGKQVNWWLVYCLLGMGLVLGGGIVVFIHRKLSRSKGRL